MRATDVGSDLAVRFEWKWVIENDWLDAIVALPERLFYNTGISTYVWVLSNHKTEARKGLVQLIDGRELYQRMRKSLGDKRNELSDDHIAGITQIYTDFAESSCQHRAFSKFGEPYVHAAVFLSVRHEHDVTHPTWPLAPTRCPPD